jgi:hypothetical protein
MAEKKYPEQVTDNAGCIWTHNSCQNKYVSSCEKALWVPESFVIANLGTIFTPVEEKPEPVYRLTASQLAEYGGNFHRLTSQGVAESLRGRGIQPEPEQPQTVKDAIDEMRDIHDDSMDQIKRLLCDMAYWRKAEYDSTLLIEYLFEKLPEDKAIALMGYLVSQYGQPEAEKSNNQEYRGFKIQPSDYGPGYFEASHPDHEDCLWAKSLEALKIEIDELIEERDAQLGRKEESNANS